MENRMNRRIALCSLFMLGALTLAGCGDTTPAYRYRLTVEVNTPEGLRTGSSVIEVETSVAGKLAIPTPGYVSHRVKGEAAAVDLGKRGVLYALLRSDLESDWAANAMFVLTPWQDVGKSDESFDATFAKMLATRGAIVLPRYFTIRGHVTTRPARPMLVTFRDPSDPQTVERVDPDDLAATFGPGVTLRRITVQMTDDPVTTGIEKRLGWFSTAADGGLDPTMGVTAQPTLAQQLGFWDFRRN